MRIKNAQQPLGEPGISVIQQPRHARVEEGRRLDQAFHVRIGAGLAAHLQAARELGIACRELGAGAPQHAQLAFIIRQQFFHQDTIWRAKVSDDVTMDVQVFALKQAQRVMRSQPCFTASLNLSQLDWGWRCSHPARNSGSTSFHSLSR